MLEQTIRKYDNRSDRLWKRIFRVLQLISIFLLGSGAYFGFSVNSIYWHIDRKLFWQATVSLILMCLPMLAVILLFHLLICRVGLEYDYELMEDRLSIYRLLGNSRKFYLCFDLSNVVRVRDANDIRPDTPEYALLRRARSASCNPDAPHLYLLEVKDCRTGRRVADTQVLVELSTPFCTALRRKLSI